MKGAYRAGDERCVRDRATRSFSFPRQRGPIAFKVRVTLILKNSDQRQGSQAYLEIN